MIRFIFDSVLDRLPYKENLHPYNIQIMNETQTEGYYVNDDMFKSSIVDNPGQIHLGSEMGRLLYYLMSNEKGPQLWLEVGSWNGKGTTTCILEGIKQRENKNGVRFVSYEANKILYEIAKQNTEPFHFSDAVFQLVYGKLPNTLPFPSHENIPEKEMHYKLYFEEEKYIYEHAPVVVPPFAPEAVILDGGEYIGYQDWEAIPKQNLKHIFLDDISIYKNRGVHQLLKHLSDWECVIEKLNDRNGWSYWRKKGILL